MAPKHPYTGKGKEPVTKRMRADESSSSNQMSSDEEDNRPLPVFGPTPAQLQEAQDLVATLQSQVQYLSNLLDIERARTMSQELETTELQDRWKETMTKYTRARNELHQAQNKYKALREDTQLHLDQRIQEADELNRKLSAHVAEQAILEFKLQESDRQIQTAREQLREGEEQQIAITRLQEERDQYQIQLAQTQTDVQRIQAAHDALQIETTNQMENLRIQAEADRRRTQVIIEQLQNRLDEERRVRDAHIQEVPDHARTEIRRLQTEVDELRAARAAATPAPANDDEQVQRLQQRIQQLLAANEAIRPQRNQMRELDQRNRHLAEQMRLRTQAYETSTKRIRELEGQLTELNRINDDLETQMRERWGGDVDRLLDRHTTAVQDVFREAVERMDPNEAHLRLRDTHQALERAHLQLEEAERRTQATMDVVRSREPMLEAAYTLRDIRTRDDYIERMRRMDTDHNRNHERMRAQLEHAEATRDLLAEESAARTNAYALIHRMGEGHRQQAQAAREALRMSDEQLVQTQDSMRQLERQLEQTRDTLVERDDQLATARQRWTQRDHDERTRMETDETTTRRNLVRELLPTTEQIRMEMADIESVRMNPDTTTPVAAAGGGGGGPPPPDDSSSSSPDDDPPSPPSKRGDSDPEKGDGPVNTEDEFEEFMTTDATEAMVEPMTVAEEKDVWADVSSHSSRESFRRRNDRPKKYVKHGRLDQPFEDQPTPTVPEPAPPPPPPPPLLPVPAGVRVDALGVPIPRQVDEMPVYVNPGLMKPLLPHNAPGWAKRNTDPVTKRRGTNSYTDQKRRQAGSTTSSEMDKMEVARAITLGDVPGPKPLKSIAYPLSGTRGRPRRMTFADTVDNLYATFANYVRSGRDITQATVYPTPERNDDDVVFYTLTNQRVNPQTGKVETLKDKSMSYTTTWGEFRKNPTFVQNLGDGRVVPVSFKYDPRRLTEPSNYSPVSKFFWFPGVRNNEWFRKRYYKPTGVRRGVHMTLKEAERLHDVLYHKFPMRWVGSSLQKQEDVANQKLDADALAQLKKAQAKEKAEFAKKLFEAMQEAHMELGQEEADAVENRWRDEEGNVFAFDEEDDEATSSPAPLPPVAVSDPTPVPPPPPPPIVAPTEAPAVLRTVGFEPPPTGSPSERPIVVRGDGVPGADVPVSSTTRTGPAVNPFFALKAPIVPDTIGLLPESDSGSSTTLSSAPAPDPVPGPPPPPSVPTGGGEVAVGSSGPRDILDIPAERQGIFDRLHGAMTRAGIHGRMAQVRPPPPPPSPSPGPDDSSTKKYSLEDYIRDNGTTGDAYTDESNWQQYLQARRLGTRHTPHPPPTPPPPPI